MFDSIILFIYFFFLQIYNVQTADDDDEEDGFFFWRKINDRKHILLPFTHSMPFFFLRYIIALLECSLLSITHKNSINFIQKWAWYSNFHVRLHEKTSHTSHITDSIQLSLNGCYWNCVRYDFSLTRQYFSLFFWLPYWHCPFADHKLTF